MPVSLSSRKHITAMALMGHTHSYSLGRPHLQLRSWWITFTVIATVGHLTHLYLGGFTCVTVTLTHRGDTSGGGAGGTY